jgi:hypothetical protein
LDDDTGCLWAKKIVQAFNKHGQSKKFNFRNSHTAPGDLVPEGEELACIADFLTIGDTFKVIEQAVEGMAKTEALKEENLCVMNSCFGPERAKRFVSKTAALEPPTPKAVQRQCGSQK